MTKFKSLEVSKWRQFGWVEIEFHPRMTVITGANGAGKTTLLNILSQHFGWTQRFVGTPRIDRRGARRYYSGVTTESSSSDVNVGKLAYDNGSVATLLVPTEADIFNISIDPLQSVPGIYLTSHRPVYTYQRVTEIPTEVRAGNELFEEYLNNIRQFYQVNVRIQSSPSHRLKAALISLATFGYGNELVTPNAEARSAFEGFSRVLKSVLPADLGFQKVAIRMPEVVLETRTGDFSLDAASGGIAALLDLAWQIYMRSRTDSTFTVLMDEPENHLHPRLQRALLPGLLDAFPQAQFIVSTHNPFVVTSVRDSNVIVLDFDNEKVKSTNLASVDRSATANQVLTDVLGVPFPAPLWVENEIGNIVNSVRDQDLSTEILTEIRKRLNLAGLGAMFPQVIDRLLPTDGTPEDSEQ